MGRPSLRALTGVRFIAAYLVVLFHCTDWVHWSWPWARNGASAGYIAVSMFFVLSGFILTYTYCGGREPRAIELRPFYVSRFARIYPVYAVGLLLMTPFFVIAHLRKGDMTNLVVEAVAVATLVQAYVPSLALAWNIPAWSLSTEASFYLAFPILAPPLVRSRAAVAMGVAVLAWALSMGACAVYLALRPDGISVITSETTGFWLGILKFSPIVRLTDFVVGIAAGRLFLDGGVREALARHATWLSLAASGLLVAVLATSARIPYLLLHNGLLNPLFALLVLALAFGTGPLARLLSTRTMTRLGEASYSLYILHLPVFIIALTVAKRLPGHLAATIPFAVAFQLGVVLTSVLCFRRIEAPMRDRLRNALLRAGGRPIVKTAP